MDFIGLIPSFGNLLYTIGAFVLALSIIVAVHEYGHYIVGRWSGIHAEVFSLGFGPVLLSREDRHGTKWQLAALPFGGYVKFLGDASAVSDKASDIMDELDDETRRHTMHGAPFYHLYLQILPRLSTPGGFEIGTNIPVNTVWPEDVAAILSE